MELPEYVTTEEVQRVCAALGLSDWTAKSDAAVSAAEAATILQSVNTQAMPIPLETFRMGLEVELEHGIRFEDANVTNNHPLLTAKIVLAHLKETMDYYQRIAVAELEGDLLAALLARDLDKILGEHAKLIAAQAALQAAVAAQLHG